MGTRATEKRFGVETKVLGTTFRSRLEARWALMFTALGWDWEYEPFDADGYIPDFILVGPHPLIIEVKPFADTAPMIPVAEHAARAIRSAGIVGFDALAVLGSTPLPANTAQSKLNQAWADHCTAGIILGDAWYPLPDPYAGDVENEDFPFEEPVNELSWSSDGTHLQFFSNGFGSYRTYPSDWESTCGGQAFAHVQRLWERGRDLTRWKAKR